MMKTHSAVGAEMLKDVPIHKDEPLIKVAYEICRWHHERYDGRGYPDGLKGEEIPISAQVVSLADAYDALTSERVYKKAFSHEKAMDMILNGECGAFNPILLEYLKDISGHIQEEFAISSPNRISAKEINNIVERLISCKELASSNRTLSMLEEERIKFQFFATMASEIQFEYSVTPPMVTFSDWTAEKLGIPRVFVNPKKDPQLLAMVHRESIEKKDNSYDTFVQALEEGDAEEAFRAIHTLKGVCLNLSFDALYGISSEIIEDLREGNLEKGKEALEELTACYQKHLRGILVYTEH